MNGDERIHKIFAAIAGAAMVATIFLSVFSIRLKSDVDEVQRGLRGLTGDTGRTGERGATGDAGPRGHPRAVPTAEEVAEAICARPSTNVC